jgi:hypothetical protein
MEKKEKARQDQLQKITEQHSHSKANKFSEQIVR